MFGFLFNTPAWQLITQSDWMTKLVLFSLFVLSVFCLWIVIDKGLSLKRQKRAMRCLLIQMKKAQSFQDLVEIGKKFQECVGGRFLVQGLSDFKDLLDSEKARAAREESEKDKTYLSLQNIEYLQTLLDQSIDSALEDEERYLPVLGTSSTVSPLVGLFGTVWGLVHAFINISQEKSTDISVIAPGIAEALTTTLAGLIVAIPTLVFFHYFSNELRKLEQQLIGISDKFVTIVKKTFV